MDGKKKYLPFQSSKSADKAAVDQNFYTELLPTVQPVRD